MAERSIGPRPARIHISKEAGQVRDAGRRHPLREPQNERNQGQAHKEPRYKQRKDEPAHSGCPRLVEFALLYTKVS